LALRQLLSLADLNKRELFKKMAIDLHILADDIQAAIAARAPKGASVGGGTGMLDTRRIGARNLR
jgi:hypothetical protein